MGAANKILIVEDDESQSKALGEAFKRDGFEVYTSMNPSEVESLIDKHHISTIFVDCLLPGTSGIELVERVRRTFPPDRLEIVLMSGLFTDPAFIKDSLKSTKAKHFLKKPFDLSEAIGLVEKVTSIVNAVSLKDNPRAGLYELFRHGRIGQRDCENKLNAIAEIHGFDLPYVYATLFEAKASGQLDISVSATGEAYAITFAQGSITNVVIPDKDSYIGKLLLDDGFVHPDDLEAATSDSSPGQKIGEKLTSRFFVSPHALNRALVRQMNIRMSKTITNQRVQFKFTGAQSDYGSVAIEGAEFEEYFCEWIASKVNTEWLKTHYIPISTQPIEKTSLFSETHPAFKSQLLKTLPGIDKAFTRGLSLTQIIDLKLFSEEQIYLTAHYLMTRGLLTVGSGGLSNPAEKLKLFKKILSQFQTKSKAGLFDFMVRVSDSSDDSPEVVFENFKKLLGEKPGTDQRELLDVYNQLFILAQQAFEVGKLGKKQSKAELSKDEVDRKLQASRLFEDAKAKLMSSSYKPALDLLLKAVALDPNLDRIKIYMIWAKVGTAANSQNKNATLKQIELDLLQIPAEQKFDALYSFVLGLIYKMRGNWTEAKKQFEKALAQDKNLIVARREIAAVITQSNANKDMFNKDLKDIVGSFFKKK